MEEWKKTLLGVACIATVVVGSFVALFGYQRANAPSEEEMSAIQSCQVALHDKYKHTLRQICLEQGFITREQFSRSPL